MSKFNAADAVEPLDYDFAPYVEKAGVIPEPTTAKLNRFRATMLQIQKDIQAKVPGFTPQADLSKIDLTGVDIKVFEEQSESIRREVVALCDGSGITATDLKKLPDRVFAAFTTWLTNEVNPKAPAAGTNG